MGVPKRNTGIHPQSAARVHVKRRKPGMVDPVQQLAYNLNQNTVLRILRSNPEGVTIKEVARNFREVHDQILNELKEDLLKRISEFRIINGPEKPLPPHLQSGYLLDKVPKAGNSWLTARRHLEELRKIFHYTRKVGRLYFPSRPVVSTELSAALHRLLRPPNYQEFNFPQAPSVGLFQTYVSPTENHLVPLTEPFRICPSYMSEPDTNEPDRIQYRYAFDEFFGSQFQEFTSRMLHLDQIIEEAIAHGKMSQEVYDQARKRLNLTLLKKGWKAYFGDAKLLAWVFAINPIGLLECIETNGEEEATRVISQHWTSIQREASKRLQHKLREDRARALRRAASQDQSKGERKTN